MNLNVTSVDSLTNEAKPQTSLVLCKTDTPGPCRIGGVFLPATGLACGTESLVSTPLSSFYP
jgi:hypothetical protein